MGSEASVAADAAAAAALLSKELSAQREALSGVNLNEELTNLLRYHGVWLKGRDDFQSFYRIFADEIQAAVQPTLTAVAA